MKVRIAMLSKWHVHATDYANMINGYEDAQITCVWDEDAKRGEAWAKELKVPFEKDLSTLLKRDDVDAVIIDTPTGDHHKVMMEVLQAGKHIFTEKVLAPTMKEALDIQQGIE